jgi:hypothetical protein
VNNTALQMQNETLHETVSSPYTVAPQNGMDMRMARFSNNPQVAAAARASRRKRNAERLAQGLCQMCGENAINPAVKKTCYACSRQTQVYNARSMLLRLGINPDEFPQLRLP